VSILKDPWITPTPENLAALAERHAGKSGDQEAETIVSWDKVTDHVSVWSNIGSHIANLVKRNPESILEFREYAGGVNLRVKGRPPWMIVRNGGGNRKPMSDEAKAKMRGLSSSPQTQTTQGQES